MVTQFEYCTKVIQLEADHRDVNESAASFGVGRRQNPLVIHLDLAAVTAQKAERRGEIPP
jgi:hypothetical protein